MTAQAADAAPIPRYRQILKQELPEPIFRPSLKNLLWFPVHAAIIGTGLWLLTTQFSWWIAPVVALVIGHSFACLGFVAHDTLHGASVKNPRIRDFLAGVGFSAFAIGPHLWKRWHNADHHSHTNVEGVDPDHLFTMAEYERMPILRFLYRISPLARNLIIFSSFGYRMSQQTIRMMIVYMRSKSSTSKDRVLILSQWAIPMVIWIGGTLLLGTQVFWWGFFAPLVVGNAIAISYIATNHFLNPLADESDVLATSLSVTLPKPIRWLDSWHSYFGAHVAHHLFPQAPCHNSRKIENKITELWPDRFHVMPITTALKLLWQTPWVYENNVTLIDPHRAKRFGTLGFGLKKK